MKREHGQSEPETAPARTRAPADYVVYVVCIQCGKMRPMEDEVCECGALLYEKMRKEAG